MCSTGTKDDLIFPFNDSLVKIDGSPSRGLSSYGYDLSLGNKFLVARDDKDSRGSAMDFVLDPRRYNPKAFVEYTVDDGDAFAINPGDFVLAYVREHINMPRHASGLCIGKSTWARCGILALTTPIEAGWAGYVTIELVNHNKRPVLLRPGDGIVQLQFVISNDPCAVSYADRNGKYQNQPPEPVIPRG